jgi:hypothetical protein
VEEERNHALTLEPSQDDDEREAVERRAPDADAFAALSSSAIAGDAILTETMQLFATDPAPPVFAAPAAIEPTFVSRERLREERAGLVARLSRRTGEEHRAIHGRINRATGAASVGAATREQLERGNDLLSRELR